MAILIGSASDDKSQVAVFLENDSVCVRYNGYGDNCRVEDFRMSRAEFSSKLEKTRDYTIPQLDVLLILEVQDDKVHFLVRATGEFSVSLMISRLILFVMFQPMFTKEEVASGVEGLLPINGHRSEQIPH